ncbi:MAG: hypothetical protein V4733_10175 [Verrucomicrobiota bacterium]
MTDENDFSADTQPAPEAMKTTPAPRPRRTSNSRARKEDPKDVAPATEDARLGPAGMQVIDETTGDSSSQVEPWAEPETVSAEPAGTGKSKRKRRRKKGRKEVEESIADPEEADGATSEPAAVRAPQAARPRPDTEAVAKLAKKIYLSEVSEEGVALINDQDARELSRRCFKIAEIFLEEQGRRK